MTTKSSTKALDKIVEKYVKAKQAEAQVKDLRPKLMSEFDKLVEADPEMLPEITVTYARGVPVSHVEKEYPEHDIVAETDGEEDGEKVTTFVLKPKIRCVPISYTSEALGVVVGRTVPKAKMEVDLDELLEDHPEYESIVKETYTVDGSVVNEILAAAPELASMFNLSSRVIDQSLVDEVAMEDPAVESILQDYSYPVPGAPRLSPVKKVKAE